MGWTYRVVKQTTPGGVEVFGVHEAYDDGDIEKPHSISHDPVRVDGESVAELRDTLARMATAFEHPVLDHDTF